MDHGSPPIRAARWVLALGRLQWGLLVAGAAWSLLGAVVTWSPGALVAPVVLAGSAAAWGAVLQAFAAHRRGAWQLLLGLAAVGLVSPLLLGSGVLALTWVLFDAALVGLLLHRDSRDWVAPAERAGTVRSH